MRRRPKKERGFLLPFVKWSNGPTGLQAYTHSGIGTLLFAEMEQWAKHSGIHRLDLHVLIHNSAAVTFYEKEGFAIEGVMKHAQCIDGQFFDEYLMAKIL
jgi:RimJ/RimL family protein N-acetyltransferase